MTLSFPPAFPRPPNARNYGPFGPLEPVSKTGDGDFLVRGFESLPLAGVHSQLDAMTAKSVTSQEAHARAHTMAGLGGAESSQAGLALGIQRPAAD
jgi:hypothetical protein